MVSLNGLAGALEMSTGNLQYHYRSKEAIIFSIYELMFSEYELNYAGLNSFPDIENLRTILRLNFELIWKYRFFYREYATLLRNDEQLCERFRKVQEQRIAEQEGLIKLLASRGGGPDRFDPAEAKNVVLIGWVLANTWLSFIESTGRKIDSTVLEEAVEMLLLHYKPYLRITTQADVPA